MFANAWGKKPATASPKESSTAPAPPKGTADGNSKTLFNGLSVKAPPAVSPSTGAESSSAFGFISGSAGANVPASPLSTSRSSVPVAANLDADPAAPVSGFSFISASPATQPPSITSPTPPAPSVSSGFSFLSDSSSVPTQPPAPSPTADKVLGDQGKMVEQRVNEELQKRALSVRLSAESSPSASLPAVSSLTASVPLSNFLTSQPAVKKKRISSKRPGYARAGDAEEDVVSSSSTMQPPQTVVLDSSTSILAGLTVYVEDTPGVADDQEPTDQTGSTASSPRASEEVLPAIPTQARGVDQAVLPIRPQPDTVEVAKTHSNDNGMEPSDGRDEGQQKQATSNRTEEQTSKTTGSSIYLTSAQDFASSLAKIDAAFNASAEKEVLLHEKKRELNDTTNAMLEEQNRAMEREDFEEAESLQLKIDEIRRELSQVEETIVSLVKDRMELDVKREDLFASQLLEIERQVDETEVEARQASSKSNAFTQQYHTERSIAKRKLDEKENALQTRLETAKTELTLTQDECDALKERIASGTVELRTDRDHWEAKVVAVDEEIALLEKQLEEKRAEKAILVKHHLDAEEKIAQVASKYATRLQEVEKRAAQHQSHLDKVTKEKEEVEQAKQELEARVRDQDSQLADLSQQAKASKDKFTLLDQLLTRLRQEGAVRRKRMTEYQKESKHIQLLQDEFVWKKSRAELLEKDLAILENQVLEDGRFLSDSTKELPELENQKQLWVSMRNFKEAGRVAAEIKAIQTKRQEAAKRLEDSKVELEEKRSNLTNLQQEIQVTKTDLDALIIRSDNEKLQGYMAIATDLSATIEEVLVHSSPSGGDDDSQKTQSASEVEDTQQEKQPLTEEIIRVDSATVAPILVMLRAELSSVNERIRLVKAKLGDNVDLNAKPLPVHDIPVDSEENVIQVTTAADASGNGAEEVHASPQVSIEELEKQLNEAVENDDFDLADELSKMIDRLKQLAKDVPEETTKQPTDDSVEGGVDQTGDVELGLAAEDSGLAEPSKSASQEDIQVEEPSSHSATTEEHFDPSSGSMGHESEHEVIGDHRTEDAEDTESVIEKNNDEIETPNDVADDNHEHEAANDIVDDNHEPDSANDIVEPEPIPPLVEEATVKSEEEDANAESEEGLH